MAKGDVRSQAYTSLPLLLVFLWLTSSFLFARGFVRPRSLFIMCSWRCSRDFAYQPSRFSTCNIESWEWPGDEATCGVLLSLLSSPTKYCNNCNILHVSVFFLTNTTSCLWWSLISLYLGVSEGHQYITEEAWSPDLPARPHSWEVVLQATWGSVMNNSVQSCQIYTHTKGHWCKYDSYNPISILQALYDHIFVVIRCPRMVYSKQSIGSLFSSTRGVIATVTKLIQKVSIKIGTR